jgi:hypothetical protein
VIRVVEIQNKQYARNMAQFEFMLFLLFHIILMCRVKSACLTEDTKILVSIASYGPDRFHFLNLILSNLNHVGVDVDLHLTVDPKDLPVAVLQLPVGLNVTYTVHDPQVGFEVAGKYRPLFHREAVLNNYYDYFLQVENDMNITWNHLEHLCTEWGVFAGSSGGILPALLRYETAANAHDIAREDDDERVRLVEFKIQPPGPDVPIQLLYYNDRKYLKFPFEPYSAMYFMPREKLKEAILKLDEQLFSQFNYTFQNFELVGNPMYREFCSGYMFHYIMFNVIPLESFRNSLIQHMVLCITHCV